MIYYVPRIELLINALPVLSAKVREGLGWGEVAICHFFVY